MPTLPSNDTVKTDQLGPNVEDANKKRNKELCQQIEACKRYRRNLATKWETNVDYRRGKPFATNTDSDRINVNIDWSVTDTKQSDLFSQVPQIRVNHPPQTLSLPWVHSYEQRINDTLRSAGIESAMEEVLPDCINAAGIGAAIVAREALLDEIEVPSIDLSFFSPEEQQSITKSRMLPDGSPLPMTTIPRILDQRYTITRISPKDLLWPIDFDGSDFDRASWIGRTGKLTWAEAKKRFSLNDEDKSKYVSTNVTDPHTPTRDTEKDQASQNTVQFDEIFYKEFQYNEKATSFATLHHLIFLGNEKEPVVDELWKGQRVLDDGSVIGCLKFPIRALTLTYLTDEAIPPSYSAIIRPQVDEINESRTQTILQRKHSLPVRWFDVNRVDPTVQINLMRGQWQNMIPIQGAGTNAIGEVARAAMSQENYIFDRTAKADIQEITKIGNSASPEPDGDKVTPISTNARLSKERARVSKFVTDLAESLGGLLCLYENPASFGEGFDPHVSKTLSYSIVTDSTVLLDTNQRLQRLFQFMNFTAKSGWINIEAVIREIATLSGLDPNVVVQKPQPRPPAEPNISLRLTGTEDMLNPLALASLVNSGQAPSLEQIEQAKRLIQAAVTPSSAGQVNPIMLAMMMRGQLPQMGAGGGLPQEPSQEPQAPMQLPAPPPMPIGSAHPEWSSMPRLNKRTEDE